MLVIGVLAFIGAVSKGNSVIGPLFWTALGSYLIHRANSKEQEKKSEEELSKESKPLEAEARHDTATTKRPEPLLSVSENESEPNTIEPMTLMSERKQENTKPHVSDSSYSALSYDQKLIAMNLMFFFGSFCSGSSESMSKIAHIMSVEGKKMGLTAEESSPKGNYIPDPHIIVNALRDVDSRVLEDLYWAYYCIIAVSKSEKAVHFLLSIYDGLGISDSECLSILQKRTGVNL